jgi:hypothetical protein
VSQPFGEIAPGVAFERALQKEQGKETRGALHADFFRSL